MWFHKCLDPTCQLHSHGDQGTARRDDNKHGRKVIDFHCHVLTPQVEAIVARRPEKISEQEISIATMGKASVDHNTNIMMPIASSRLVDARQRLADMDSIGIDIQVLSPSPTQYYYWADIVLARDIVQLQNQAIAELVDKYPERFAGLGAIALQHPALACEQLEYAIKTLGLKGVEISTFINGKDLDDGAFREFWSLADALGAIVFIHPLGTTLGARTASHYLVNTIGQPLETTVALSRLIFSGILQTYPEVRILAAHGGGFLPTYSGRSDHAWAMRPEARTMIRSKPSDQLRRIWFDTVVYDSLAVRHLVDRVGVSQIVIGTDYPFDMGHYNPLALVDAVPGLTDDERIAILGKNAERLLAGS